jgi:uncharacterized protein YggU (UPF0235/DUF167 family)
VQPGARRNEIVPTSSGVLKVRVTAPAEHGRANKAALTLLAQHLGVPARRIELQSGFSSRNKRFQVLTSAGTERLSKSVQAPHCRSGTGNLPPTSPPNMGRI